jgi:hypothetical protein
MYSSARQLIWPVALALALAMALAACSGDKNKDVDPNIFPAKYKDEILFTMSTTLINPANVRDAFFTEPALRPAGRDQRYFVCVRSNSRDGDGNYLGSKDRIAYFYGGHLNQLVDASKEQCGNAPYKPFPELEKLCLAKSCV